MARLPFRVDQPQPNDLIGDPLLVAGSATTADEMSDCAVAALPVRLSELALEDLARGVEPEVFVLSDAELRAKTDEFRRRHAAGAAGAESLDDLLPEAYAVVREAARRTLGQRHFDVQLMGGAAMHLGNIAEMRTGEACAVPARTHPRVVSRHAGWFLSRNATRSPGTSPAARWAPALRRTRSLNSRHVQLCSPHRTASRSAPSASRAWSTAAKSAGVLVIIGRFLRALLDHASSAESLPRLSSKASAAARGLAKRPDDGAGRTVTM